MGSESSTVGVGWQSLRREIADLQANLQQAQEERDRLKWKVENWEPWMSGLGRLLVEHRIARFPDDVLAWKAERDAAIERGETAERDATNTQYQIDAVDRALPVWEYTGRGRIETIQNLIGDAAEQRTLAEELNTKGIALIASLDIKPPYECRGSPCPHHDFLAVLTPAEVQEERDTYFDSVKEALRHTQQAVAERDEARQHWTRAEQGWNRVILQAEGFQRDYLSAIERGKRAMHECSSYFNAWRVMKLRAEAAEGDAAELRVLLDLERLAELEHRQWIEWSQAIASLITIVDPERALRWEGLWVPYDQLSEAAKEQDRIFARRILAPAEAQEEGSDARH